MADRSENTECDIENVIPVSAVRNPRQWLTEDILTDEELPLMDENRSTEDLSQDSAIGLESGLKQIVTDGYSVNSQLSITPGSEVSTLTVASDGQLILNVGPTTSNGAISIDLNSALSKQTDDDMKDKMRATIDELDEFLIRNDTNCEVTEVKDEKDDGNDTDELLRMLGDDDSKTKKRVFKKTAPTKAVIASDEDSMDEEKLEGSHLRDTKSIVKKRKKHAINGGQKHESPADAVKKSANVPNKLIVDSKGKKLKCTTVRDLKQQLLKEQNHHDSFDEEIEAEFLDEENFDLDDKLVPSDVGSDSELEQQIHKPEMMDEEVLTDIATDDEDEYSFYDELPSSDSENIDEWFELDIRTERAGDYLPLLGDKAEDLLLKEKKNVKEKLVTLKQGFDSIKEEMTKQAKELEDNRQILVKLDALLGQV